MPELPEVETAVRELRPLLSGRVIHDCWFTVPRQLGKLKPLQLRRLLSGKRIESVTRRGKHILIKLDTGLLVVHLRMTGRLHVAKTNATPHEHERAGFLLDQGSDTLYFRDPRTLGTISYYKSEAESKSLRTLGWEPLEVRVTTALLKQKLAKKRMAIKPVLLDQSIWAGIGNIYASESLWLAQIHPGKRANTLTGKERERLIDAVPRVLGRALERGGSTLRDFMSPDGREGSYQNEFCVYDREGELCARCGEPIVRIVQAQRSTYYCRNCQKR